MTHSALTAYASITSDSQVRGSRIDRFIVHHAATTSLAAILSLFQPGGRTVSANYALGSDGTLVLAVDEDRRAWTSASKWDDRAVTIEVANSVAGGSWPVSDAAFDKLARLIADVSIRYGFPINDDTVLTHQELYARYGESYATSCPGDLQRRKGELIALANHYRNGGDAAPNPEGETMSGVRYYNSPGGRANIGELSFEAIGPSTHGEWAETYANVSSAYNDGVDVGDLEFAVLRQSALNRRGDFLADVAATTTGVDPVALRETVRQAIQDALDDDDVDNDTVDPAVFVRDALAELGRVAADAGKAK